MRFSARYASLVMPNYRRWRRQGATYFFTVVTHRRRRFLTTPLARNTLRAVLMDTRAALPFDMFAAVLLPDHLHCIWTLPPTDDDFPRRWAKIKLAFTKAYLAGGGTEGRVSRSRRARAERGVWQPRFWEHLIRDDAEQIAYRDYIHLNPVKHGYVRDPLAWPRSSVHRHLRDGWLEREWTGWTRIELPFGAEV